MASPLQLLAVVALVPAAINPALLVRGEMLASHLCGGGTISIPLDNPLPGSVDNACCNKGCQSDEKRKRGNRLAS